MHPRSKTHGHIQFFPGIRPLPPLGAAVRPRPSTVTHHSRPHPVLHLPTKLRNKQTTHTIANAPSWPWSTVASSRKWGSQSHIHGRQPCLTAHYLATSCPMTCGASQTKSVHVSMSRKVMLMSTSVQWQSRFRLENMTDLKSPRTCASFHEDLVRNSGCHNSSLLTRILPSSSYLCLFYVYPYRKQTQKTQQNQEETKTSEEQKNKGNVNKGKQKKTRTGEKRREHTKRENKKRNKTRESVMMTIKCSFFHLVHLMNSYTVHSSCLLRSVQSLCFPCASLRTFCTNARYHRM